MEQNRIRATIVDGFLGAGKTTYIQDCLKNDFFYKRGKTLLLVLEEGEEEYDQALLASRHTVAVFWDGEEDPADFLAAKLAEEQPDRIYVEMNAMREGLMEKIGPLIRVDFFITIMDGSMLPLYYSNMRQLLQNTVKPAHQVIIRNCEKAAIADYGNLMYAMNPKTMFLWEAPEGYHEKAFGVNIPFDLSADILELTDSDFTPFYLDSLEKPERYNGKKMCLLAQIIPDPYRDGQHRIGRQVMTCCLADVQYFSFACDLSAISDWQEYGWYYVHGIGELSFDAYRQKFLKIKVQRLEKRNVPAEAVIGLK